MGLRDVLRDNGNRPVVGEIVKAKRSTIIHKKKHNNKNLKQILILSYSERLSYYKG